MLMESKLYWNTLYTNLSSEENLGKILLNLNLY